MSYPNHIVTLVHGTFAANAEWTRPNSRLSLRISTQCPDVMIDRFGWTGGNDLVARREAADQLARHLMDLSLKYPDARLSVVAHSHGGNIAIDAASEVPELVDLGICCMATPFLQFRVLDENELTPRIVRSAMFAPILLFIISLVSLKFISIASAVGMSILGLLTTWAFSHWFSGGIIALRPLGQQLCAAASPPPTLSNLKIIRKSGDEASLVLSLARFGVWASGSLLRHLARENRYEISMMIKRNPIPKYLVRLFAFSILSIILGCVFTNHYTGDAAITVGFVGLMICITILLCIKTSILDDFLLAISTFVAGAATLISMKLYGTGAIGVGAEKLRDELSWPWRMVLSLGLTIMLEVNAEATPVGEWPVHHFGATPVDPSKPWTLSHSIYDDPDVIETVTQWVKSR
jgi:pimeloyl-ACP methyl ester carboxylesterase